MGKVKAWAMEVTEHIQNQFIDGEIDARHCAEELNKCGLMDPDEIEMFIDEHTGIRAQNLADATCAMLKDEQS